MRRSSCSARARAGRSQSRRSRDFGLDAEREPQVYAAGVKELWQLPDDRFKAGAVIHTLGYPLPPETFGGGFIYGMAGNILDIGMVIGLDYKNPTTDPHNELQRMKQHPAIAKMLEGGTMIRYGAKAIPEGGLFAMPRAYADGLLIVGDTAGFLNGMRLKGIHLGMKSGMIAAETIWEALQAERFDAQTLSSYERRFRESWAYRRAARGAQLPPGLQQRNVRRACSTRGSRRSPAAPDSASSTSSAASPATSGWSKIGLAAQERRRAQRSTTC